VRSLSSRPNGCQRVSTDQNYLSRYMGTRGDMWASASENFQTAQNAHIELLKGGKSPHGSVDKDISRTNLSTRPRLLSICLSPSCRNGQCRKGERSELSTHLPFYRVHVPRMGAASVDSELFLSTISCFWRNFPLYIPRQITGYNNKPVAFTVLNPFGVKSSALLPIDSNIIRPCLTNPFEPRL